MMTDTVCIRDDHSADSDQNSKHPPRRRRTLAQKLHLAAPTKHYEHRRIEEYATTVVQVLCREVIEALRGEDGMSVAKTMFKTQLHCVAQEGLSEEGKEVSRVSAREAFTGSYDAVERKTQELYEKVGSQVKSLVQNRPWYTAWVVIASAAFVGLLGLGVLLAVWRFVFFGFGPRFGSC